MLSFRWQSLDSLTATEDAISSLVDNHPYGGCGPAGNNGVNYNLPFLLTRYESVKKCFSHSKLNWNDLQSELSDRGLISHAQGPIFNPQH